MNIGAKDSREENFGMGFALTCKTTSLKEGKLSSQKGEMWPKCPSSSGTFSLCTRRQLAAFVGVVPAACNVASVGGDTHKGPPPCRQAKQVFPIYCLFLGARQQAITSQARRRQSVHLWAPVVGNIQAFGDTCESSPSSTGCSEPGLLQPNLRVVPS